MNARLEEAADVVDSVESLRLELERCQRELGQSRSRAGELERAETVLAGENRLLEMVAKGASLPLILGDLCRLIEELSSGSLCGILLVDTVGARLEHGAAPSLPPGYNEAIQGRPVNVDSGPCAMAACLKEQVIVADIASDPRWEKYAWCTLALTHGLRSCWSTPILSSEGTALGTFAIYWREPRIPTLQDQKFIAQTTHLAAVAIERKRAEDSLRRSEVYLAEAEKLNHTGSWAYDVARQVSTYWSAERYRISGFDPAEGLPSLEKEQATHAPGSWSRLMEAVDRAIREKADFQTDACLVFPDGSMKHLHIVGHPILNSAGNVVELVGSTTDVTIARQARVLLAGEKRLLEMIAKGDSLSAVLTELCRLFEELCAGGLSSILLLDPDTRQLKHGAAPSLPQKYIEAIDGGVIGPSVGSCGTAAYCGTPVIVSDIATDPLWADYREVALAHGLRACWSTPILSSEDQVLGTIAIYYRKPLSPVAQQLAVIDRITHLASIALEKKRAEETLRRSEAYLAEAQKLSSTGSFGWNVATGELYWSAETFCIVGHDRTVKPTLDLVFERVHPEDKAYVQETLLRATRDGTSLDFEHRLLLPDGTVKHVHVLGQPVKTGAGTLEFVGAVMEITGRKRAEEALHRSEAYLAEAQKLSQTGSFCLRVANRELISSVETVRIGGWEPGTKPSLEQALERVHPDDRLRVQSTLEEALQEGSLLDYEHRLLLPGGAVRYVHTVANPMRNASGEVELVGAVMDVTEKKRSEDALRAAKARFKGILEIAEDAIISVDSNHRIVLFNQGAEKVFGYAQAEIIGKSLDLLLPHRFAPAHQGHIKEFAQSQDVARVMGQRREVFGLRKDGSEFPAEASISKLDLDGELVFTVILRDITERKQAAEALRASEKFARSQAEALTQALEALARESSPDRIVEHVLRTMIIQLDAHSCSVWLRGEVEDRVVFEFAFENNKLVIKSDAVIASAGPSFKIDDVWPWPEVFRTGKPYVLQDIREGPLFPWREHVLSLGVITILIVPMLIAGRVEGVVGIRFTNKRTFRSEEMELAQALANQTMLAVQLTRLTAQSRQSGMIAERNRMAREMHDTLAQGFTGVIVQLEAVADASSKGLAKEAGEHLVRASELARESLREARRSVRALRPVALEDKELCEALENLIRKMTTDTTVKAEFIVQGEIRPLPPEWDENLLRISQEVLTNVLRHAQASHFTMQIKFAPDEIRFELRDNGHGFDPAGKSDGFGLLGMRERVEGMGGHMTIQSATGTGTTILIVLPGTENLPTSDS